jgi:hypothetical protein
MEIREGGLSPYRAENTPTPDTKEAKLVSVTSDGWLTFMPVTVSGPRRITLAYNDATVTAEIYIKPFMRDWILVGLAEGTAGYNTVSGNMEGLNGSGAEEDLYKEGRIAFFAKGQILGKWLLTMAYDSAKGRGETANSSLFQTIDPNTYYTLYGDASQQQYDAASARKLYLKIERDQFYAMFGDYDTGLSITELTRYSRRLNGIKSEMQGKNTEFNVFASQTNQAFVKDELLGDGTSGLYHLSRKKIVLNSEKILIEVRDRFRSEIVISTRVLTRFTDYSIDYESGTIFFKEPVQSKDENFNPIYIVVEYESNDSQDENWSYGGRGGVKFFNDRIKAGVSYIHEGQTGGSGNLYGVDATVAITESTRLRGEYAATNTEFSGTKKDDSAYLAELSHRSKHFDGRLYVREQGERFGLGQQNGSETGTRKLGAEGAYRLSDTFSLTGQGYRQYNLATSAERDLVEAQATLSHSNYKISAGIRQATDTMGDGSTNRSLQLTSGASTKLYNDRLGLRLTHDQSIGNNNNNPDFPTRTILGADFMFSKSLTFFADQEFAQGNREDAYNTRLGMKATPWKGGAITSSMSQQMSENNDRMFANVGLLQKWEVTEKLSLDAGLDRTQTVKHSGNPQFNTNVPPASGGEDFTAISLGSTYKETKWSWTNRLEYRTSANEDKWGGFSGFIVEAKEGLGLSARLQIFSTETNTGDKINSDLRLGLAYRPKASRWIILDRLDLLLDRDNTTGTRFDSWRIVNNINANCKLNDKTQMSLQYGAKYVFDTIDNRDYSGYTDLFGLEGRYDLTKKWDLGIRGSILHSWNSAVFDYSSGLSIGYNIMQNAWVSLGYNFFGFTDKDFSAADYTAQGPYLRFRFKFDQNSVKDAAKWLNQS